MMVSIGRRIIMYFLLAAGFRITTTRRGNFDASKGTFPYLTASKQYLFTSDFFLNDETEQHFVKIDDVLI
jgi:hypothetical protein